MKPSPSNISVVIRTIGRDTLYKAVRSATKEFSNIIVVADGDAKVNPQKFPRGRVKLLRTGRRYDKYGSMAMNMGAYAVKTEYFCLLDDDDEFIPGAGQFMSEFVENNPSVDIFIPGIKFVKEGFTLCMNSSKGISYGNVAVPTYRTSIFSKMPMLPMLAPMQSIPEEAIDFAHIKFCVDQLKCSWKFYEKELYLIRPGLEGTNGRGQ